MVHTWLFITGMMMMMMGFAGTRKQPDCDLPSRVQVQDAGGRIGIGGGKDRTQGKAVDLKALKILNISSFEIQGGCAALQQQAFFKVPIKMLFIHFPNARPIYK